MVGDKRSGSVRLLELDFDALTADETVDRVFEALGQGRGGMLLTANLDMLRRADVDAEARALYRTADLVVADGMPIVWAASIAGTPLPMRVAGSSLVASIAHRAATDGRTLFLLGGDGSDADGAARTLLADHPSLRIGGVGSPRVDDSPEPSQVEAIAEMLVRARAEVVFVALGSPKQEALAVALRPRLGHVWFVGVGITFAFLSGRITRAPELVQRLGFEWAHRLAQEPRRLARRYLIDGLPFAAVLFGHALVKRLRSDRSGPSSPAASS